MVIPADLANQSGRLADGRGAMDERDLIAVIAVSARARYAAAHSGAPSDLPNHCMPVSNAVRDALLTRGLTLAHTVSGKVVVSAPIRLPARAAGTRPAGITRGAT